MYMSSCALLELECNYRPTLEFVQQPGHQTLNFSILEIPNFVILRVSGDLMASMFLFCKHGKPFLVLRKYGYNKPKDPLNVLRISHDTFASFQNQCQNGFLVKAATFINARSE